MGRIDTSRHFGNESSILDSLRFLPRSQIMFYQQSCPDEHPELVDRFLSIYRNVDDWIDSSGKSDPTPDFFNPTSGVMLEVMRVDDHAFESDGKIINKTAASEGKMFSDAVSQGVLDEYPNAYIITIGDSGKPTLEDHNFQRYRDNFKRVVREHLSKTPTYRANHPECPFLAFLIYDESCAYFESAIPDPVIKKDLVSIGRPHFFALDPAFFEIFQNSDVDCVIWFAPYKLFLGIPMEYQLPKAVVYFNSLNFDVSLTYDEKRMFPVEE